jgi:hypothetical protein
LNFVWPRAEIAQQLDVWGSVAKRVAVWTRVLAYSVLGEPYPSLTPFPYTNALALADLHDCRQLTPVISICGYRKTSENRFRSVYLIRCPPGTFAIPGALNPGGSLNTRDYIKVNHKYLVYTNQKSSLKYPGWYVRYTLTIGQKTGRDRRSGAW